MDGVPRISIGETPPEPGDYEPLRMLLPLGNFGIGSTFPAVAGQCDYHIDVEATRYGILGPGPEVLKVGLALDAPVSVLRAASDAAAAVTNALPTVAADDSAIGTVAWTNPSNALTSNNSYATAVFGGAGQSHYLKLTDFSAALAAIPSTSTIVGFKVEVEGLTSTGTTATWVIRPYRAGTLAGTAATNASDQLTTSEAFRTAAGLNQPAGITFAAAMTRADVLNTGFGIGVSVTVSGAMTVSIDSIRLTVYLSPANAYIYAGAGRDLVKLRQHATVGGGAALGTVSTKTFTNGADGAGTEVISDVIFLKSGVLPTDPNLSFYPALIQPADAFGLVGFRGTAPIEQIDAIGIDAADTYKAGGAATAYAGKFVKARGSSNTTSLVFKTTGQTGSSQTAGSFSRLQSATIPTTGTNDLTGTAAWGSSTSYQVGDFDADIASLAEYQAWLAVGKPDGVYGFNIVAQSGQLMAAPDIHRDNTRFLLPVGGVLLVPDRVDLRFYTPSGGGLAGLGTLTSNLSLTDVYPTAAAKWGDRIYIAWYSESAGTSTIVEMREKVWERVPQTWVHRPLTVVSTKVTAMLVADNGQGVVRLLWNDVSATASKYDVGYLVLRTTGTPRYQSGGLLRTTRAGSIDVPISLEQLIFETRGCDASNFITPYIAWDANLWAGSWTSLGNITTNGVQTVTFTSGTADNGRRFGLRFVWTLASATAQPLLLGLALDGGVPGILVEGQRVPATVTVIQFEVDASMYASLNGNQSPSLRAAYALYDAIAALTGPRPFIFPNLYGDLTSRNTILRDLKKSWETTRGREEADQYITVNLRELRATVAP